MANIHIIVGDAHDKPESNKRRFKALGNFLLEFAKKHRQDNITTIDMGDFEDMPSLSSYERGKLEFEGRRYLDDIESSIQARHFVYDQVNQWKDQQIAKKRRAPRLAHIALGGNHFEGRIKKFVSDNPELQGVLSVEHATHQAFGIDYVPFLVPRNVDGIQYVHYWQSRGTGKPIAGGKYPAQVLLREKHCSTVVGHSHVLDRAVAYSGGGKYGKSLYALSSGCFLDPEERESYAGQSNEQWYKGIVVLFDVLNGFPLGGEHFIKIDSLLKDYL